VQILRLLLKCLTVRCLSAFCPDMPASVGGETYSQLRRSAWASTLTPSLGLTRQGDVVLEQDAAFKPIYLSSSPSTDRRWNVTLMG
jgi:hypothetical protein